MVTEIELTLFSIECAICEREWSYSFRETKFGIPVYEDEILPDDDPGEWGGVSVCPLCYYLVRGLQSEHKGRIQFQTVKRLLHIHPDQERT